MTEGQTNRIPDSVLAVGVGVLALIGLVACNAYSYLLFHSIAELFSIVVACGIFMILWNSRGFVRDSFFLLLCTGCLFVAGIDLLHMLAYKGMGVFPGVRPDLAIQLWIAARGLQTASLLLALSFVRRRVGVGWMLLGYILVTSALLASIFVWPVFPTCFVEGQGLTPFKRISEYVICVLLVVAIALLYRERNRFDSRVFLLLTASIAAVIVAELAFTFYVDVYGLSNVVGHFAKITAFCFMYAALVQVGLTKPRDLLLRGAKYNERELRSAHRTLQAVLDTTPVRIFWKDRDLTYLGCNKPFADDAGLASPEEIVGKEDQQLPWREEADLYQADDRAVIESGEPKHNYEELQTGPDGEKLWVKTSKIPLRDEAGKIHGVLGCYEDITEHKQAEEALGEYRRELALRNEVANVFLTVPDDEMYAAVLQLLLDAVESKHGVFGYLNGNGDFVVPTMTRTVRDKCQIPDKTFAFPRESWGDGSWPRAIREKRTICQDEPSMLMPEMHIAIERHIAMPTIHRGEVVGLVQVANKETDYTERDIELLETLGRAIAPVLAARLQRERHEREREGAAEELRRHARELEAFNASMVGREGRMVELKKEVNALAEEVGREPPYPPVWDEPTAASGQGQTTPAEREPDEV
jgi:PAS domain S-box-containing protein